MRKPACSLALPVLLLLFGGCTYHYHYVPNNMVIPAIERQHDAMISLAASDYGGREIQAVYSPMKHVALMYNDMKYSYNESTDDSPYFDDWSKGRLWEGGLGGYYNMRLLTFSLLGGYGQGWAENSFGYSAPNSNEHIRSKLEFQRWFVQPGFVLQTRKVRFGMAFRQVWLHYHKGTVDVDNIALDELNAIRIIEQDSPFSLAEFGMTLGYRIRPFTFSYNSSSIFGKETSYYDRIRFAPNNFNFMVTLDLYELWRKKGK